MRRVTNHQVSTAMPIAANSVASFHYILKDESGVQLESSHGSQPMTYLHGHDSLLKGLEDALEGKDTGATFSVTLPPALAFGELREDSEMRVPLSQLRGAKKWEPGMQAVIQTNHGHQQVTIIKVGHTMATVDTNHPMAGKTLVFDVEVVEVREASQEELSHGHAHGPGGHHH
jgi:FKBP-type peptidyl-prolyl cis-trans isomerase SlyD